jgi:hypothetical protein
MLAPRWFRIRVGPYVRRERDKRNYFLLFSSAGYVAGLRRGFVLCTRSRVSESDELARSTFEQPAVVVFRGMERQFEPLRGRAAEIREELIRITEPRHRPPRAGGPFLALHVRCGDFTKPERGKPVPSRPNQRIPVEWYVLALRQIRNSLGAPAGAIVFSDGTDKELAPLLAEPGVERCARSAVADLLTICNASALIASGSTFSMWASFLGQVPAIWYPGQSRGPLLGNADVPDLEPEWDGGRLPPSFVAAIAKRWEADPSASSPAQLGSA